MWSREFSLPVAHRLLVLGSFSFLTPKEHPDMPFFQNLMWKMNDSDDLLMNQINKPRESWHCYSPRRLSEVKWQYLSIQSARTESHAFCFNCMSGLCCELRWLDMPVTTCFICRFSVPLLSKAHHSLYVPGNKFKKKKNNILAFLVSLRRRSDWKGYHCGWAL